VEVSSQNIIQNLHDKITLFKHLGIEPLNITSKEVRFRVALGMSRNHKGTAFGGSLYADAVLAAYTLVLAGLRERGIPTENIVIARGEIEYLRPVDSDFEILCQFPSDDVEETFFSELKAKGKGRTTLTSQVLGAGGSLKASLTGVFVVKL